jgi:alpha/beta superfamily hydrolase
VIQGDADELVDVDDTVAWVDSLEPGPDLQVLPGVDHFFHGKLVVLREAVTTFVTEHLNS